MIPVTKERKSEKQSALMRLLRFGNQKLRFRNRAEKASDSSDLFVRMAIDQYLGSGDYNGLPLRSLPGFATDREKVREVVQLSVANGRLAFEDGRIHSNPHIKAFSPPPIAKQLEFLKESDLVHACVYPMPEDLERVVDTNDSQDRPFSRRLMLGEPQLEFHSFDLSVLEHYRNDPRYHYSCDDVRGWISVQDEFGEPGEMREHDQVFLKSFGFGYDDDFNRAVVVFTCDLANLSAEHQQHWNAKRHASRFKMHPDYHRNQILGEWGEKVSVFGAFTEELKQINIMTKLMGKPPLFRNEYDQRPKGFSFLLRSTTKEFNDFVLLLDQMMSENLNKAFFRGDIELESETTRSDGKIIINSKGTIQLLEQWFQKEMRFSDPEPFNRMIAQFKNVRKLRQNPAHKPEDSKFDHNIFKEQRKLAFAAYGAVRVIRLMLANHPLTKSHTIPDWLYKAEIWPF